jgi:hypothetical protein
MFRHYECRFSAIASAPQPMQSERRQRRDEEGRERELREAHRLFHRNRRHRPR